MNWAYIAGFFDGEGSIVTAVKKNTIAGGSLSWQLAFTQNSTDVLFKIKEFVGTFGFKCSIRECSITANAQVQKNKPCYGLNILGGRRAIRGFLEHLLPYLVVKKAIAQDLLRFMKLYPSMHGQSYERRQQLSALARKAR